MFIKVYKFDLNFLILRNSVEVTRSPPLPFNQKA